MAPTSEREEAAVWMAISSRDSESLATMLRDPTLVDYARNEDLLHTAAGDSFLDGCATIVNSGCEIDAPSRYFGVALDDAVYAGSTELVEWFLSHNALVDGHETCVSTPLLSAGRGGHLEIAKMLLDAGADIERGDGWGETALDLAYALSHTGTNREGRGGQHKEVMELLRSRGGFHAYVGQHDWSGFPHESWLRHIEASIGPLNARTFRGEVDSHEVQLLRARPPTWAAPPSFFVTSGLIETGSELGLVLPPKWPLNREALHQHRFSWPLELLLELGSRLHSGARLRANEVLEPGDERLSGLDLPHYAWHLWEALPRNSALGTPQLLVLVPEVLRTDTKRRFPPKLPSSLIKPKWDRIEVPLGDLTPRRLLPEAPKPAGRYLYPNTPPVPTAIEYEWRPIKKIPSDEQALKRKVEKKKAKAKAGARVKPKSKPGGVSKKSAPRMKATDEAETPSRTATKAKGSPGSAKKATVTKNKQDKPTPKATARPNSKSTPKSKKSP